MNIKRISKIMDSILDNEDTPSKYDDILEEITRIKLLINRDTIINAIFEISDEELDQITKELIEELGEEEE